MLAFKVYDDQDVMQGATRDATFAATLVQHLQGGRVKHDGRIIYRQHDANGRGDGDAGASFDIAAEMMLRNAALHQRARAHVEPSGSPVDLTRSSDRSFSS